MFGKGFAPIAALQAGLAADDRNVGCDAQEEAVQHDKWLKLRSALGKAGDEIPPIADPTRPANEQKIGREHALERFAIAMKLRVVKGLRGRENSGVVGIGLCGKRRCGEQRKREEGADHSQAISQARQAANWAAEGERLLFTLRLPL